MELCIIKNNETFYPIHYLNNDFYYVSRIGNIFSKYKNDLLKQQINHKGYNTVYLKDGTKSKTIFVHRIVSEVFLPNPNKYPQVNHIDGNKLNNNVDNLEWCSNEYNMKHSWDIGLREPVHGEEVGTSILKESQVCEIYMSNKSSKELSNEYNVSAGTINSIKSRKSWQKVTAKLEKGETLLENQRNNMFSYSDIYEIYTANNTNKQLSKQYGCSESTIRSIRNGNSYGSITTDFKKGENLNRLTEQQVRSIYLSNGTYKSISEYFNISISTVSSIKNGKNYTKITEKIREENNNGFNNL